MWIELALSNTGTQVIHRFEHFGMPEHLGLGRWASFVQIDNVGVNITRSIGTVGAVRTGAGVRSRAGQHVLVVRPRRHPGRGFGLSTICLGGLGLR